MSLVDYDASSSSSSSEDDDEEEAVKEQPLEPVAEHPEKFGPYPAPQPLTDQKKPTSPPSSQEQPKGSSISGAPSIQKLPDAAMLLDSPAFSSQQTSSWSDHSARVAAAMEENASKKRAPNGLPPSHPHPKLPRGNSARPRNVPDTLGGALVPPQLKGRSNVVTEDINKLFVHRKSADPSC